MRAFQTDKPEFVYHIKTDLKHLIVRLPYRLKISVGRQPFYQVSGNADLIGGSLVNA
ncbi:MAG: hypothetical protein K2I01_03990 [Lachnospiraceae bacterium]|nr:hypothetical protein [Lachnospiraceae bacterium]